MRDVARACLAVAVPLIWGCASFEAESMALLSEKDAIIVGDTTSLSLEAHDGSMPSARSVAWATSDSTIATVDELGVVTGTGRGLVIVEARVLDYTLRGMILVWATAGPFLSIDTGVDHNCALTEDGTPWCWGSALYGQIGTAFPPDRCYFTRDAFIPCAAGAIPVATQLRFAELTAGHYHTCGLTAAGAAHCWGLNDQGQLGDGGTERRPIPVPVAGEHVFKTLTAGGRTTCGLTVDDAMLCWGARVVPAGPSPDERTTPTPVAAEHRFALAATSGYHTCGVTPAGTTHCWGGNGEGEVGVPIDDTTCGRVLCEREPRELAGAPPFTALALTRGRSCGLTAAGAAWCWGGSERGQLGDGRWEVRPVAGGLTFITLDAGRDRTCGLDEPGFLYCWGSVDTGSEDGGSPVEIDRPVPVETGLTFARFTIGQGVQCGVDHAGVTWCWGNNVMGAVGSGRAQRFPPVETPMRVVRHAAR